MCSKAAAHSVTLKKRKDTYSKSARSFARRGKQEYLLPHRLKQQGIVTGNRSAARPVLSTRLQRVTRSPRVPDLLREAFLEFACQNLYTFNTGQHYPSGKCFTSMVRQYSAEKFAKSRDTRL